MTTEQKIKFAELAGYEKLPPTNSNDNNPNRPELDGTFIDGSGKFTHYDAGRWTGMTIFDPENNIEQALDCYFAEQKRLLDAERAADPLLEEWEDACNRLTEFHKFFDNLWNDGVWQITSTKEFAAELCQSIQKYLDK